MTKKIKSKIIEKTKNKIIEVMESPSFGE